MVFSGVLEELTGAPAVGWTVRLQDAAGDDYDAPVAADGSFSIPVNAGSYDLMVFDEFGNQVETDNVDLSQSMTGVTLTLPPLQALTLTAVDGSAIRLAAPRWGHGLRSARPLPRRCSTSCPVSLRRASARRTTPAS